MGDILIIGGGFAGLWAAKVLSRNRLKLNGRRILLVDLKTTSDFLPMLPDVAGGRIRKENACLDLVSYLDKLGVNFQQGEVIKIDTQKKEVVLKGGDALSYEFLVVSCGSLTDFYGMEGLKRSALKLDTVEDALILQNIVSTYPEKKILVIGGGYTGVEVASNLACLLRRRKMKKYSIHIIEKGEDILGPLPEWMKEYCRINLCRLKVGMQTGCSLKESGENFARLSNGMEFSDPLVVWAAGVATPGFVGDMKFEKDRQGRLLVDDKMMFTEKSFAVGDAACFKYRGQTIRMAVQFSIAEAVVAARNILRIIAGQKKLVRYRPLDLGLLVPMANRRACGKVFFFRVSGLLGWFFHYCMCIYRSHTFKNRFGVFCDAFLKIGW